MTYTEPLVRANILRHQSLGSGTADLTAVLSKTAVSGTVTTGTSSTVFIDTGLGTTNTYLGRMVRFKGDTTTVALRGITRYVSAYAEATSQFTVAPALPATPAIGDTFEVLALIPPGAQEVAFYECNQSAAAAVVTAGQVIKISNAIRYWQGIVPAGAASQPLRLMPPVVFQCKEQDVERDITVLIDSTTTWVAAVDFYTWFVCY